MASKRVARAGTGVCRAAPQLSDEERRRLLALFDDLVGRIPTRPAAAADREIATVRRARRAGSRRATRPHRPPPH